MKKACSNCHKEYDDTSKFCPFCGAQNKDDIKVTCPNCNTTYSSKFKFCPKCGAQNKSYIETTNTISNDSPLDEDIEAFKEAEKEINSHFIQNKKDKEFVYDIQKKIKNEFIIYIAVSIFGIISACLLMFFPFILKDVTTSSLDAIFKTDSDSISIFTKSIDFIRIFEGKSNIYSEKIFNRSSFSILLVDILFSVMIIGFSIYFIIVALIGTIKINDFTMRRIDYLSTKIKDDHSTSAYIKKVDYNNKFNICSKGNYIVMLVIIIICLALTYLASLDKFGLKYSLNSFLLPVIASILYCILLILISILNTSNNKKIKEYIRKNKMVSNK